MEEGVWEGEIEKGGIWIRLRKRAAPSVYWKSGRGEKDTERHPFPREEFAHFLHKKRSHKPLDLCDQEKNSKKGEKV